MEPSFFFLPVPVSPLARTNMDDVGQSARLEWMPPCIILLHMQTALDYNRCRTHVHVPPFPLVHMIASFLTFFQTHNSPHLFRFCPNLVTAFSYLSLINQKPIEVVFQYASCSDHRPGRLVKVPQAPKLLHAYSRTGF